MSTLCTDGGHKADVALPNQSATGAGSGAAETKYVTVELGGISPVISRTLVTFLARTPTLATSFGQGILGERSLLTSDRPDTHSQILHRCQLEHNHTAALWKQR